MECKSVAIIGAGPAGLTLAAALSQRGGYSVTIFEQANTHFVAPEYNANRSYTIDITGHGAKAIAHIGAVAHFDRNMMRFKGLKPVCINNSLDRVEGDAWTGSRGTICQTLQQLITESSGSETVTFKFNTTAEVSDIEHGEVTATTTLGAVEVSMFDLVVGADGGGSRMRALFTQQTDVSMRSINLDNYSIMLPFDQGTEELDPEVLYLLSLNPLCVAGAVNGKNGKTDPLWFCQVGFKGLKAATKIKAMTLKELKKYIGTESVLRYCSDKELIAFQAREPQSTGKGKVMSTWTQGRCVILGDAAAPFPPIGQGVNAAMEGAMVLDRSLALNSDVKDAIAAFEAHWKPQTNAMTKITEINDPLSFTPVSILKMFILDKLGAQSFANSKKGDMSYVEALNKQETAQRNLLLLGCTMAAGMVAFSVNYFQASYSARLFQA